MNNVTIIQISDLHISLNEFPRGVDTKSNFIRTIDILKNLDFDFLVITGDICFSHGEIEIYNFVKEKLSEIKKPFYVVSGNHDDINMINKVFNTPINNGRLTYHINHKNFRFSFLDSSSGTIDIEDLKNTLSTDKKDIIIFTHYPPCKCGIQHMDSKYPLLNIDEVQDFISNFDNTFHFYCGHYHHDRSIVLSNSIVNLCPSLYYKMDASREEFAIDNYNIGWRRIEVSDTLITNDIVYI